MAIDPILLAAAVAADPGDLVLDAGVGTGAAALCLAARVPGCRLIGLDSDPELLAIARRNVAVNGLDGRIELLEGDLERPPAALGALLANGADQVMTNPPFLEADTASPPPDRLTRQAHVSRLTPARWLAACLRCLRPRGCLTLIHRADRLDAILAALTGVAGDVVVYPLWPGPGSADARRVLVRARKAGRGPARLARGLVLHQADGHFTAEAEAILRRGAALQV